MTDDLLREVRALRAELAVVHGLVAALRPQATDDAFDFLVALADAYGTGSPFLSVDVIDFCTAQPVLRRDLHQALRRLCGTDCLPTAQQLGMALQRLVRAPPAGFRVEASARRGTTQWTVQDLRNRVPPAPHDAGSD